MKAYFRCPYPNALLAALLVMVFAGAPLLPVAGAEAKSKKSSSSSTSKKKAAASKSKPKTSKSKKSTPRSKKTATASPTKKSSAKASSKSTPAKATPAPEPEKDDSAPKPADSEKTGTPEQPAPKLPVRDPEFGTPPMPSRPEASASKISPDEKSEKASEEAKPASVVSLSPEDILGFDEQPDRVKNLIRAALDLTGEKLTYTFGSADPANGGMDCSGAIHYLLKKQGFDSVPRDASGQYVWARKNGKFFAVVSHKADSFEFGDLLPGDLLFWNGTYEVDRDPPVTHTMIYLGVQRKRAQHVMWGSSDGRTFDNKSLCGVSVFDFKMPAADKKNSGGAKADFLGYARIPGLRD